MTDELKLNIDHMTLSVEDLERAITFYEATLAPLGMELVARVTAEQSGSVAFAGFGIGRKGNLWIAEKGRQSPTTHFCFRTGTKDDVAAFHTAGLAAGGTDNGGPGYREIYHPSYYAAFVLDPEGHNVEAVAFVDQDGADSS